MKTAVILGLAILLMLALICAVSFYQSWRGALEQKGDALAANRKQKTYSAALEHRVEAVEEELTTAQAETVFWQEKTKAYEDGILKVAAGESA